MLTKIKSFFTLLRLVTEYEYDNIHRIIYGLPRLKRSEITADLFVGSQYNLVGLQKLRELGVTAIINMRMHSMYPDAQYEGFHYLHLPTPDNTAPPLDVLIKGAEFADTEIKKGGKVYIHCRQGLGRGPTMAIAYLIKSGLTFADAFALVKRVRTFINPRRSQIERLKELEIYYNKKQMTSPSSLLFFIFCLCCCSCHQQGLKTLKWNLNKIFCVSIFNVFINADE